MTRLGALDSGLRAAPSRVEGRDSGEGAMKNICWALIGLGALAFVIGTFTAFTSQNFLLAPQGYWRGAVGFVVFAIALRLMDEPRR